MCRGLKSLSKTLISRGGEKRNIIFLVTLQSLGVQHLAEVLCSGEAEATAQFHHQHTVATHLRAKAVHTHTESQEQLIRNACFSSFLSHPCYIEFGGVSITEVSAETCRDRFVTLTNNRRLLILQMINSLEINISSGQT